MDSATVTDERPVHIDGQQELEAGLGERERPLSWIPIEQIRPGENPRQGAGAPAPALAALATSTRRMGTLQSVLVRRTGEEEYELIAGERRYWAAREAGRSTLPAMVIEPDEEIDEPTRMAMAFAENAMRDQLTPLEEAMLLAGLISGFGFTLEGAAEHLGMGKSVAEGRMDLLTLPKGVRERLEREELTLRNAATLAPIAAKAPGVAEALADRVASGAQSKSALDSDPAAALRRLADEERQPEGTFLIPFGPHDTINLDEVAGRIRDAATHGLVDERSLGEVEEALAEVGRLLAVVPEDLRTAKVADADIDRARAYEGLIEYREGAYHRSGVLIDPTFGADWARQVAATLAESGGEHGSAESGTAMPEEREDAKALRERRKLAVLEGRSSNAHFDRELINRFDHQSEVSLDQARVIATLMLEFLGRELASGHRVVREAWLKRDVRPSRGGTRTVEEYPSIDEVLGLLEADLRRATSGPALIGRLFGACATAVLADQSVLGAGARPNLELPYTLGREEQLQGLAPAALWREVEVCLGEWRADALRPHFTTHERDSEPARDRLERSDDLTGEVLELMPEESGEGESTSPAAA